MSSFDIKAYAGKVLSLFVPMVLLGCSAIPLGTGDALAQSATQPAATQPRSDTPADESSQLMYELMIAELAGRRGQLDVAMAGYLSASERTDDPRVSERATQLALFGNQWEAAETAARRWVSLDPDNAEAAQLLAQSLLRQDKADAAAELFAGLVRDAQGAEKRRQVLRATQFELQRNENPAISVAVMRSLADTFNDDAEAHLGLARAHITDADSAMALSATDAALTIDSGDTDALLLRAQILSSLDRADEAFSSLKAALQGNPENTRLRLGYTQLLVESGRHDEVLSELAIIRGQSGANAENLLALSLLAIDAGFPEQAQTYLMELRASGAYMDQASFYLGRISDEQQAYEQAIVYYDEVADGELYFNSQIRAAELTALTGNIERGRERLQQLAPRVADPLLQTRLVAAEGRILQNADQHEEAVSVFSEGLERFPDNSDLLYSRALAADNAGKSQLMITDLNRLIELDSNNAHALNALGYHYADKNIELEQAEQLLVKASALLPNDPAIMDSLGWLKFRQGKYAEAITLLRTAYELYPDPEIAAHLGAALWLSGAREEAQTLIDKALEGNPDDERLLAVRNNTFK